MSYITNKDPFLEIWKWNVPWSTIWSAMWEYVNWTVVTAWVDVCRSSDVSWPDRLPTPDSAWEQMTIVSDDSQDTSAWTWARTVHVHYLDAAWAEQMEIVTMNWTTWVDTVATDIRFVNDFHTQTVWSNWVAKWNITIIKKWWAIATDLYNLIAEGWNKSLVPHRMVPAWKALYLQDWHAEEAQDKRCVFRIRSTDDEWVIIPWVFLFKDTAYIKKWTTWELPLHNTKVPALSIIKVSYWADQSASEWSCWWWGVLVDD